MHQGNAPSWLYSFVDLAFLLVIALSLMALDLGDVPDVGELQVPYVHGSAPLANSETWAERWQVRVHPAERHSETVFELAAVGAGPRSERAWLASDQLHTRLAELRRDGAKKPLLAPHEDSRSADLLAAVGLLETFWPSGRPVLVAPLPEAE